MNNEYVRVREDGETYLEKRRYADIDTIVDDDPTLTVEEMCELMDRACESENYHSMVGLPERLIGYLHEAGASKKVVAAFIKRLFDTGGPMSFT